METRILREGTTVNVMCSSACEGMTCKCKRVEMKREYLKLPGRWRLKVRKAVYAFFRGGAESPRELFYTLLKKERSVGFQSTLDFIRTQIYTAKSDYRTERESE